MTERKANLSHVDPQGKPQMVDVSPKAITRRQAIARAELLLPAEVVAVFDGDDVSTKKGSVVHTAIIAGTQAVKNTASLIPFCHPLPITGCDFTIERVDQVMTIDCTVKVEAKTGVEMEALTGASVAALTVYDMLKALSHTIEIRSVRLLSKHGGKSDYQVDEDEDA